ncbi:hypothetical protein ACLB2K_025903 [Fragaria x ananassa]
MLDRLGRLWKSNGNMKVGSEKYMHVAGIHSERRLYLIPDSQRPFLFASTHWWNGFIVIRPYLQSDVTNTLVALSMFFQKICAKELNKSDVRSLQEDIVYIMCKLERIFPPTFFDIMIHLMIHLPEQMLLTGPVQYTWCYPNERQLGDFKKKNKNKCFPEGSITSGYIQAECVTYCSAHLNDEDRVGESSGAGSSQQFNLSVVSNVVQPYGRLSNSERLSNAEIKEAHWSVLQHCNEAERYYLEHLERQDVFLSYPLLRRKPHKHASHLPIRSDDLARSSPKEDDGRSAPPIVTTNIWPLGPSSCYIWPCASHNKSYRREKTSIPSNANLKSRNLPLATWRIPEQIEAVATLQASFTAQLETLRAELTAFLGTHVLDANPSGGDGASSSSSSGSDSEESSDASATKSEEAM